MPLCLQWSVFVWNWIEAYFSPAAKEQSGLRRVATWKIARETVSVVHTLADPAPCSSSALLPEHARALQRCTPLAASPRHAPGHPAAPAPQTFHLGHMEDDEGSEGSDPQHKDVSAHMVPPPPAGAASGKAAAELGV